MPPRPITPADHLGSVVEKLRNKQMRDWRGRFTNDLWSDIPLTDYMLFDIDRIVDDLAHMGRAIKGLLFDLIGDPSRIAVLPSPLTILFRTVQSIPQFVTLTRDPYSSSRVRLRAFAKPQRSDWTLQYRCVELTSGNEISCLDRFDSFAPEDAESNAWMLLSFSLFAAQQIAEREVEYVDDTGGEEYARINLRRARLGLPHIPSIRTIIRLKEKRVIRGPGLPIETPLSEAMQRVYTKPEWTRKLGDGRVIPVRRNPELLKQSSHYYEVRP